MLQSRQDRQTYRAKVVAGSSGFPACGLLLRFILTVEPSRVPFLDVDTTQRQAGTSSTNRRRDGNLLFADRVRKLYNQRYPHTICIQTALVSHRFPGDFVSSRACLRDTSVVH